MNRTRSKSYSDSTPPVFYSYDPAIPYGKGQLGIVDNGYAGTNYTGYDALGRVTGSNEQTASHTYPFSYVYNLAGSLLSEVYPSGRVANTKYDSANRVAQISGALGATKTTYASQFSYAAHGPITGFVFNNNNIGAVGYAYNSRLQPAFASGVLAKSSSSIIFTEFRYYGGATSSSADGTGTTDNGNPTSMMDMQIPGQVTNFTYDKVNRLESATEILRASGSVSWARNFTYDAFGNMWVTTNTGVPLAGNTPTSPGQFTSLNQIAGFSYDKAGNQTSVNGNTLTYDAENRVSKVVENGGATETYVYDGDGTRVQKINSSGTTVFLHDALGQLVAEYADTKTTSPCTTCYLVADVLGSTRMVIDQGGSLVGRHDFLPFGEEIPSSVGYRDTRWDVMDEINQKFTGKERDAETGMDYFGARYYGSALGRFTSPDSAADETLSVPVPYADLENPQSLNLYSYAANNPLRYTDPDGHDYRVCVANGSGGQQCTRLNDDQYQQLYNQQNGKQGISLPGGPAGGSITCGGANCGSVSYTENSLYDPLPGIVVGAMAGQGAGLGLKGVGGFVAGLSARTAGAAIGETAGQGAARVLLGAGGKQAAKEVIEGLAEGAQKAAAKRAVARATKSEAISISQSADGTLSIAKTRPGFDGSRTITVTIPPGGVSSTVQTAQDAAGNLVHYDPKN